MKAFWKRYDMLIIAIGCWGIALAVLFIMGCASRDYQPLPEGEMTRPPAGYTIYCDENPESIFCKERDE